jgi:hypothetical protein
MIISRMTVMVEPGWYDANDPYLRVTVETTRGQQYELDEIVRHDCIPYFDQIWESMGHRIKAHILGHPQTKE